MCRRSLSVAKPPSGLREFKRAIHVVDSTTIELMAPCMGWAKRRRRKAAAKCHRPLDQQSFPPRLAIIDTAREADAKRAGSARGDQGGRNRHD